MISFERVPINEKVPSFAGLELNISNRNMYYGGKFCKLSPSEYQLIWLLIRNKDNPTKRSDIEDFLLDKYGEDEDLPTGNTTNVVLSRLRKKLLGLTGGKIVVTNLGDLLGWKLEEKDRFI